MVYSISACNSQVSVENVSDLHVRSNPLNPACTHYSGDIDRYDIPILQNYGMIESITPPASWQCDSFRILPSSDIDCPEELTGIPCFTLEDYYYNPSDAPNIYMELQPGSHTVNIEGSTFYNNSAIMNGGVIYLDRSTINIVGSNFSNNLVGGNGGVLYLSRTQATVHNSTFTNNSVPNTGEVVHVTESTLTISETNFLNITVNGGNVISQTKSLWQQSGYS